MSRPILSIARPLRFSTSPPASVRGSSRTPSLARDPPSGLHRRAFTSNWTTTAKEEDPEWLVMIPDHPDPGTLKKRLSVRAEHFREVRKPFKSGLFNLAGAILNEPLFPPRQFNSTNPVRESELTTSRIDPTPPPNTAGTPSSPFTSSPTRQESTNGFQNPTDSARGFATATAEDPEKVEPEAPDMRGSVILARAPSKEAVYEQLRQDVYTKSGVWDLKNARVVRFLRAEVD